MDRVTFNLNEYIYVRPTQKALDYLRAETEARYAKYGITFPYTPPKSTKDGYYAFQAWQFIQNFKHLFPGHTTRWEEWFEDGFNVQLDPGQFRED